MRTSSLFLWQLIRSLSSAEKLYFRRNYAVAGTKEIQLYIRLFDAISRQKTYDEAALIRKFAPELHKGNLAAQKHYLQEQVIRAMISYEDLDDNKADLYYQIRFIRLLRKKGLEDQALDTWKKTVEKARSQEEFAKLNLLKREFEKMVLFSSTHTRYDELYALFRSNAITYQEYADLITLRDLYTELLLIKRRAHYDLEAEHHRRLAELDEALHRFRRPANPSFWFDHYLHMNRATLLYLFHAYAPCLDLLKNQWEQWHKNPGFIQTDAEFYVELLYMINYAGVQQGDFDFVFGIFQHPLNLQIRGTLQQANFEAIRFLAFNRIYNKTAQYEKVKSLLAETGSRYNEWEPYLNADLNRTLNISIGISSFVLEDYPDALLYIKRGITYFREGSREEHAAVAQLLLLLITYCMNNTRLFDAQYRSCYNYFYKRKKKHPFETALLHCLQRSFYSTDAKYTRELFRETIQTLETHQSDPVQQMVFGIFNFPAWLKSRLEKISYRRYVEKSVRSMVK